MPANVLVLGCGRSGTSIFGELFEAFDGYRYLSEPRLDDIDRGVHAGPIAVKVPREAPGSTVPSGCSVSVDAVRAVVGDPLVVFWQVRHPLDTVCSLRVGIDDGWAHHPRPADWQDWLQRPLLERCAHHWATINEDGYDHVRAVAVVNRFEDMLSDPQACARRTAELIGVDSRGSEAAIERWSDRVQDTNNAHFIEARTSRRHSRIDHVHRVGRWRENLTETEVESIHTLISPGARTFGYELPHPG
ncbi:MAG: hypothetical protein FJW88_14325 [Actinobacteria bacterium]|nr:hypothetical protein [Actinomycetota bacterium]